jgi:SAM-dependent methyltransferase
MAAPSPTNWADRAVAAVVVAHSEAVAEMGLHPGPRLTPTSLPDLDPRLWNLRSTAPPRGRLLARTLAALPRDASYILDVGAGTGIVARVLRAMGATSAICAVEPAPTWAAYLRELGLPGVEVQTTRIEEFEARGTFDAAVAHMVLHHIADLAPALRSIRRALGQGGVFSCTDKVSGATTALGHGSTADALELGPRLPHPTSVPEWTRPWMDLERELHGAGFSVGPMEVVAVRPSDDIAIVHWCCVARAT